MNIVMLDTLVSGPINVGSSSISSYIDFAYHGVYNCLSYKYPIFI